MSTAEEWHNALEKVAPRADLVSYDAFSRPIVNAHVPMIFAPQAALLANRKQMLFEDCNPMRSINNIGLRYPRAFCFKQPATRSGSQENTGTWIFMKMQPITYKAIPFAYRSVHNSAPLFVCQISMFKQSGQSTPTATAYDFLQKYHTREGAAVMFVDPENTNVQLPTFLILPPEDMQEMEWAFGLKDGVWSICHPGIYPPQSVLACDAWDTHWMADSHSDNDNDDDYTEMLTVDNRKLFLQKLKAIDEQRSWFMRSLIRFSSRVLPMPHAATPKQAWSQLNYHFDPLNREQFLYVFIGEPEEEDAASRARLLYVGVHPGGGLQVSERSPLFLLEGNYLLNLDRTVKLQAIQKKTEPLEFTVNRFQEHLGIIPIDKMARIPFPPARGIPNLGGAATIPPPSAMPRIVAPIEPLAMPEPVKQPELAVTPPSSSSAANARFSIPADVGRLDGVYRAPTTTIVFNVPLPPATTAVEPPKEFFVPVTPTPPSSPEFVRRTEEVIMRTKRVSKPTVAYDPAEYDKPRKKRRDKE